MTLTPWALPTIRAASAMLISAVYLLSACSPPSSDTPATADEPSPYLLVSAGDVDEAHSDFLAVIDLRDGSATFGSAISTLRTQRTPAVVVAPGAAWSVVGCQLHAATHYGRCRDAPQRRSESSVFGGQ